MVSLWNIYLLFPLFLPLSLHVIALTGHKETQQLDTDTAVQFLTQPLHRPHGSSLALANVGPENAGFLSLPLSWSLSSSEEADRQGVIGEYSDAQENTESSHNEKGLIKETKLPRYQSAETNTAPIVHPTQTGEYQSTEQSNDMTDSQLPFLMSASLPSHTPDQNSPESAGPGHELPTPPTDTWTKTTGISVITQGKEKIKEGTFSVKETENGSTDITDPILDRATAGAVTERGKSPVWNANKGI